MHKQEWWFRGFHHFYAGIAGFIIAFVLLAYNFVVISIIIFILSLALLIDDYYQHFMQTTKNPKYHSPLHKLYGYIYSRSNIIRKLNKWADKLFGIKKT